MKEIIINNKKLNIKFDSEAMYRYSKEGGDQRLLEGKGNDIPIEKSFYILVLFVWSMLKGESKDEFPVPEDLSKLFLPLPDETSIKDIYSNLQDDLKEIANA